MSNKYINHTLLIVGIVLQYISCYAYEREILVIIPSFNNRQWYLRNVTSVLNQKYTNFKVLYIDDCSTDGTYEAVYNLINDLGQQDRVQVIRNKSRRGALANIYYAVYNAPSNTIIITIDGDDWLKDDQVFEKVNTVYEDPRVWMTYGQFEVYPDKTIGFNQEMPQGVIDINVYREYAWITSHLRTFYAGLFQQIKFEDLIYNGSFFPTTWDQAFMIPMLEMAAGRIKFIPDILYVYNQDNQLNDYKVNVCSQIHCEKVIRSKSKYQKIESFMSSDRNRWVHANADVVILSVNSPMYAYALIESILLRVNHTGTITVLYQADDDIQERYYQEVKNAFQQCTYKKIDSTGVLTQVIADVLKNGAKHVLFAHDGCVVTRPIDCRIDISTLEKTGAYGFYYMLGHNIIKRKDLARLLQLPVFISVEWDIDAWQFSTGEYEWATPFDLSLTMYRKTDVLKRIENVCIDNSNHMIEILNRQQFNYNTIGLCHKQSCGVMFDYKNPSLYQMFDHRLKIDVINAASYVYESIYTVQEPWWICR